MSDAGFAVLAVLLAGAIYRDLRDRSLPNALMFCGTAAGLVIAAAHGAPALWLALCGGFTGALLLLPLYVAGGMAGGDIKLMGMAGVFLGMPGALYAVTGTLIAGGLLALGWRFARSTETSMPFAPAIAAGCGVAVWMRVFGAA